MLVTALLLQAAAIEGRWRNPSGSVTIEVARCGAAWCGTVIEADAGARADARRGGTATLIGTQLLTGLKPTAKGHWKGRLFVPDMNKRTHADIAPAGPDRIKVRGCLVGGVLCKSQLWSRAD